MKKIAILGLHLGYGGVEQAIVNLANMLCDKYQVELVITYQVLEEIPYQINSKVKIKYLTNLKPNKEQFKQNIKNRKWLRVLKEGFKSIYILKKRVSVMKTYIKHSDADVLISSRILYTKLVSKYAKKNILTIAEEHCHHNGNEAYIKKVIKACKNIDYLIPVSNELTQFYKKRLLNSKTQCIFIPNCLEYWPAVQSELNEKRLISVGRLSKEKGYLDLIDVFSLVHQKYPDWKLHIIGDGDQKVLIREKINKLKLCDAVHLHGFQNKEYIYQELQHSSVYVMCSYEESFGIVLLEAASFGIPLLAFASAQGAHEIISNDQNGYLIPNRDHQKMAEQIEMLIVDQEKRKELGQNAKTSVEPYSFSVVQQKWLEFLSGLEESRNEKIF